MTTNITHLGCGLCNKLTLLKNLTQLKWRYSDPEKKYGNNTNKIQHIGTKRICKKCLKDFTK